MTEWQPIETAPKDGTQFVGLLHFEETGYELDIVRWEKKDEKWDCHLFNPEHDEVIASIPIPESYNDLKNNSQNPRNQSTYPKSHFGENVE